MATDALMPVLQASVAKTATFQGAALDFLTRPPMGRNVAARVIYSAASNASRSNTVTFTVEGSVDNVNWGTIGGARPVGGSPADVVTLTTTPQAGEVYVELASFTRDVRLVCTIAGAGTSPTITYQGDIVLGMPG
jgi:hypothetical protein